MPISPSNPYYRRKSFHISANPTIEQPIQKPAAAYRPGFKRPPTPPPSLRQARKARSQWDSEKQPTMVQPTKSTGSRVADRAAILMLLSFAASIMLVGFLSSFRSLNWGFDSEGSFLGSTILTRRGLVKGLLFWYFSVYLNWLFPFYIWRFITAILGGVGLLFLWGLGLQICWVFEFGV